MNSFELEIKNNGIPNKPEYSLNLKIDEEEFLKQIGENSNALVFDALEESCKNSGELLIFTCSCGIADCGGWDYVKITHESGKIIWNFRYGKEFHFEFPIDYYKGEIARIRFEIKQQNITLEPLHVVEPQK